MVKVKICGITSLLDAEKSLELGADMLGFNFYAPSPRAITAEKAHEIILRLPRESFNVALFVNAARENVTQAIALGEKLADGRQAYRALQFHGEESADYCRGWNLQVIKAFRLKEKAALDGADRFFRGLLFARLVVSGLWRLGNGVSLGMARRVRCQQADSFRRARGGQRGSGD